jgi:hypothetical protein
LIRGRYKKLGVLLEGLLATTIPLGHLHVFLCSNIVSSVVDPHWFQCGSVSGSGSIGQCRSGSGSVSRVLMTKFFQKLHFKYPWAYIMDVQATVQNRVFGPQNRTSSLQIKYKISSLLLFLLVIFALCPHRSGSSRPKSMRIRNTDYKHIRNIINFILELVVAFLIKIKIRCILLRHSKSSKAGCRKTKKGRTTMFRRVFRTVWYSNDSALIWLVYSRFGPGYALAMRSCSLT